MGRLIKLIGWTGICLALLALPYQFLYDPLPHTEDMSLIAGVGVVMATVATWLWGSAKILKGEM